jgi:hypothetical protein
MSQVPTQMISSYSNCKPLSTSDPAYDEISKGIRQSWPNACITMIDTIDIPHLRTKYEKWRETLRTLAKDGEVLDTEYTAYHGTKARYVEDICRGGFNPDKGRVMAYGYGIYFATNFSMSWHFTDTADELEMSYIFICKLLPGRIQPTSTASQPPQANYHSQANNPRQPTVFAIPSHEMMIPEYLVRFSKKAETPVAPQNPLRNVLEGDAASPLDLKRYSREERSLIRQLQSVVKKGQKKSK